MPRPRSRRWLIGEALPRGVAEEWARWGRSDDWLVSYFPDANARFAAFTRDILAYTIADDEIAPPRAVSDLLRRFTRARVKQIDVTPAELSRPRIGHLGLFRPINTQSVWEAWLDFAVQQTSAASGDETG